MPPRERRSKLAETMREQLAAFQTRFTSNFCQIVLLLLLRLLLIFPALAHQRTWRKAAEGSLLGRPGTAPDNTRHRTFLLYHTHTVLKVPWISLTVQQSQLPISYLLDMAAQTFFFFFIITWEIWNFKKKGSTLFLLWVFKGHFLFKIDLVKVW